MQKKYKAKISFSWLKLELGVDLWVESHYLVALPIMSEEIPQKRRQIMSAYND